MRNPVAGLLLAIVAFGPLAQAHAATDLAQVERAVKFVIQIPKVLGLKLSGHPVTLEVTEADVSAGEMLVRGALVEIVANDRAGYMLRTALARGAFEAVRITGLPRSVEATGDASDVHMPSMAGHARGEPMAVEYRLRLASNARPGRYSWPVALSLQAP